MKHACFCVVVCCSFLADKERGRA